MIGINLAGAEFGTVGGAYGTAYIYPTKANIDYYASQGMEIIRLPFRWERIQPQKDGALDPVELGRIREIVDYAAGKGMTVALDVHNYGMSYGNKMIGSADLPNSSFADLWSKLATEFRTDDNVWFGIMNEPHKHSATQWIEAANAAIKAIRDTGADQKILVPGTYWSGAHSWMSTDNHSVVGNGVKDPLNNFAFEVHQYFDHDSSGTSTNVVSETIGADRLKAITAWAKEHGHELFMGEFGAGQDARSLKTLDNMMKYMSEHPDVWIAATYWAGGPWWGDYFFSLEPKNGVDKPQLEVLMKYEIGNGSQMDAAPIVAPVEPDTRELEEVATPPVLEKGEASEADDQVVAPIEAAQPEPEAPIEKTPADLPVAEEPEIAPPAVIAPVVEEPVQTAPGNNGNGKPQGKEKVKPQKAEATEEAVDVAIQSVEALPLARVTQTEATSSESPVTETVFETTVSEPSVVRIDHAAGEGDHYREGEKMGYTISVTNALEGQKFQLWMANTAGAEDFSGTFLQDLRASVPEGVGVELIDATRLEISLKPGSYDFTFFRDTAINQGAEKRDQAPWSKDSYQQVDFWISDFEGGLTSTADVSSSWIKDVRADVPPVAAEPAPITETPEVTQPPEATQPVVLEAATVETSEPVASASEPAPAPTSVPAEMNWQKLFEQIFGNNGEGAPAGTFQETVISFSGNVTKQSFKGEGFEASNVSVDFTFNKVSKTTGDQSTASVSFEDFDWMNASFADTIADAAQIAQTNWDNG
jgi:endoglucanase